MRIENVLNFEKKFSSGIAPPVSSMSASPVHLPNVLASWLPLSQLVLLGGDFLSVLNTV